MATPETPGAVRRIAHVTYDDGHTETLHVSKPRTIYEASKIEGADADPSTFGFILAWVAAGQPGMNGGKLTADVAIKKMEAWLDKLDSIDFEEQPIVGPPTKPPGRSRASRGSSGSK